MVGLWNLCFSRPFNDWKMKILKRFFQTIHGKRVFLGQEDKLLLKE